MYVSGELTTYPSPNLTFTGVPLLLTFGENVDYGDVVSFPETYIDQ